MCLSIDDTFHADIKSSHISWNVVYVFCWFQFRAVIAWKSQSANRVFLIHSLW